LSTFRVGVGSIGGPCRPVGRLIYSALWLGFCVLGIHEASATNSSYLAPAWAYYAAGFFLGPLSFQRGFGRQPRFGSRAVLLAARRRCAPARRRGACGSARRSSFLLLATLATVWISDRPRILSARFGKRKLGPFHQSRKTWEGVPGRWLQSGSTLGVGKLGREPDESAPAWILPSSARARRAGMIGDLFESLIKTPGGVKDSGTFSTRHGGNTGPHRAPMAMLRWR